MTNTINFEGNRKSTQSKMYIVTIGEHQYKVTADVLQDVINTMMDDENTVHEVVKQTQTSTKSESKVSQPDPKPLKESADDESAHRAEKRHNELLEGKKFWQEDLLTILELDNDGTLTRGKKMYRLILTTGQVPNYPKDDKGKTPRDRVRYALKKSAKEYGFVYTGDYSSDNKDGSIHWTATKANAEKFKKARIQYNEEHQAKA